MYKVFKVKDKYQVFWVEGEERREVDGGLAYPYRQGAYRRCKQLNEGSENKMQEVKIKIEAMRNDCAMLVKRIEEDFGGIEILVIDPLKPIDTPVWTGQERIIQFSRKIWSKDEPKDHILLPAFMPNSPTYEEVLSKLAKYRELSEVLSIRCKIGNEIMEGGEIR